MKLLLPRSLEPSLIGCVDSDWAGDCKDKKSTRGYIFRFSGGVISWISKKQLPVLLSPTEA